MPEVAIGGVNMNNDTQSKYADDTACLAIDSDNDMQSKYADDTACLVIDSVKLQGMINTVNKKGKEYGMSINIKRAKVMAVTKKEVTPSAKVTIEGRATEQVKKINMPWPFKNRQWQMRW